MAVNQGIVVRDVEGVQRHLVAIKANANQFAEDFEKAAQKMDELENLGVGLTAVRTAFNDIKKLNNQMCEASENALKVFQIKVVDGQAAISGYTPEL